jgi:ribosomal protein S18 acetylase RimI-like enzyme
MIDLRAATVSDGPDVLALWRDAESVVTHTDDLAGVEALVAHDPQALIVAEDEGRIVGSVVGAWDGWRGEVYRLAVAPSHRRQGLAGRLLAASVDSLHARGARRIGCIVVADEVEACGFWDASDFAAQVNRVRYVHPPD